MDENEYRALYKEINPNRCVFEKAINNRRCDCEKKRRFLLATREGVGCESAIGIRHCTEFLDTMRQNARFSLKAITIDGPMPHNKELQVQAGGCHAFWQLLFPDQDAASVNIHQIVEEGLKNYHTIDAFPYGEIVKGIVKYQSRKKRKKR